MARRILSRHSQTRSFGHGGVRMEHGVSIVWDTTVGLGGEEQQQNTHNTPNQYRLSQGTVTQQHHQV